MALVTLLNSDSSSTGCRCLPPPSLLMVVVTVGRHQVCSKQSLLCPPTSGSSNSIAMPALQLDNAVGNQSEHTLNVDLVFTHLVHGRLRLIDGLFDAAVPSSGKTGMCSFGALECPWRPVPALSALCRYSRLPNRCLNMLGSSLPAQEASTAS